MVDLHITDVPDSVGSRLPTACSGAMGAFRHLCLDTAVQTPSGSFLATFGLVGSQREADCYIGHFEIGAESISNRNFVELTLIENYSCASMLACSMNSVS